MRGLSALRAERGQLSLTSSFYASAHPAGGFSIMGKCGAVSYDRTNPIGKANLNEFADAAVYGKNSCEYIVRQFFGSYSLDAG